MRKYQFVASTCCSSFRSCFSSFEVFTRCIIRNWPFKWKTGMSNLYRSYQVEFSGSVMSTSCKINLSLYGWRTSLASSHSGHGAFVNKVNTGRALLEAERFLKSPKEDLAICRLFPWNQSILILIQRVSPLKTTANRNKISSRNYSSWLLVSSDVYPVAPAPLPPSLWVLL